MTELRPSNIFYSQDSISNRFSGRVRYIGETLDKLLSGFVDINYIPYINVVRRNEQFYSVDNRRLWVFKKAEELGYLETIKVNITLRYNPRKFTTTNSGQSVRIRGGDPGGYIWRSWKPAKSLDIASSRLSKSSLCMHDPCDIEGEILTLNKTAIASWAYLDTEMNYGSQRRFVKDSMKENKSQMVGNYDSRPTSTSSQNIGQFMQETGGNSSLQRLNSLPDERWNSLYALYRKAKLSLNRNYYKY